MKTTLCDIIQTLQAHALIIELFHIACDHAATNCSHAPADAAVAVPTDPQTGHQAAHTCAQAALSACAQSTQALTCTTPITGLDSNSIYSQKHHIFVCKGRAFKTQYLLDACARGAICYICSEEMSESLRDVAKDVPAIIVSDIRLAMALAAPLAWGRPDLSFTTIGITGTKGKSTTTYMLKRILDVHARAHNITSRAGTSPIAIMGSIVTYDGAEEEESTNTTPEAPDFWRHLAQAKDAGITHFVMEISSQALKHHRIDGVKLDYAAFLNISPDHISPVEHPNFEDYFQSKLKIFSHATHAVINRESDHFERILAAASCCQDLTIYGSDQHDQRKQQDSASSASHELTLSQHASSAQACHYRLRHVSEGENGIDFEAVPLKTPMHLSMHGSFNASNALCAIALARACGASEDEIAQGLNSVSVPGRMEFIHTDQTRVQGIVDYAHNKLSYESFFTAMREEFPDKAFIAVFGAPGGKAFERRHELPEEAARWVDLMIFTEEDPGLESAEAICEELKKNTPKGAAALIEPKRDRAIARAVEEACKYPQGALVCMLGKGDELSQHEGTRYVPVEPDRVYFEQALKALKENKAYTALKAREVNKTSKASDTKPMH